MASKMLEQHFEKEKLKEEIEELKKPKKPKKIQKCGSCGEEGHNKKKCHNIGNTIKNITGQNQ